MACCIIATGHHYSALVLILILVLVLLIVLLVLVVLVLLILLVIHCLFLQMFCNAVSPQEYCAPILRIYPSHGKSD